MYGTAHPDAAVAQAAQPAVNVPVAIPMAEEYVPTGPTAANTPVEQIPKTEGKPPAGGGAPPPGQAGATATATAAAASPAAGGAPAPAPAPVEQTRGVTLTCPQGISTFFFVFCCCFCFCVCFLASLLCFHLVLVSLCCVSASCVVLVQCP